MAHVTRGKDKQLELKPNILFIFLFSRAKVLLLWEATGMVPARDLWSPFRSQSAAGTALFNLSCLGKSHSALKSQHLFCFFSLQESRLWVDVEIQSFLLGCVHNAVSPGSKTLHTKPCVNTHNAAHPAEEGDLASADRVSDLKPEADDRPKFRPQCATGHACSRHSCLQ